MKIFKRTMVVPLVAATVDAQFINMPEWVRIKSVVMTTTTLQVSLPVGEMPTIRANITSDPSGAAGMGANANHVRFVAKTNGNALYNGVNVIGNIPHTEFISNGEDLINGKHVWVRFNVSAAMAALGLNMNVSINYEVVTEPSETEKARYAQQYG